MDKRLIFRYRSWTIKSQAGAGWARSSAALEMLRLTAQAAVLRGQSPRRGKARQGQFDLTPRLQEKPRGDAASARTANRHWWPGARAPRWTGESSLRN